MAEQAERALAAPRAVARPPEQGTHAPARHEALERRGAAAHEEQARLLSRRGPALQPLQPASLNRTGLPDGLKAGVEALSGLSLDDVKVHYNSSEPAQLSAQAFTQGNEIHVGPGQDRHLAHEAWHVVQQKAGRVRATERRQGVALNCDAALEREADIFGARALRAEPGTGSGPPSAAPASAAVVQRKVKGLDGKEPQAWIDKMFVHDRAKEMKSEDLEVTKIAIKVWQNHADEIDPSNHIDLSAILMQADVPAGIQKRINYWLGITDTNPLQVRTIGTLDISKNDDGKIISLSGRPSLYGIESGSPSQARRHIVAWHTLRQLLNNAIEKLGADSVVGLAKELKDRAPPAVSKTAFEIAEKHTKDLKDREIIWLAVVLNNTPHNLWLGSARENIAINTMGGWLYSWLKLLDGNVLSLADFKSKVSGYKAKDEMTITAQKNILKGIENIADKERVGLIVEQEIFKLEVDVKKGEGSSTVQNYMFMLAHGELNLNDLKQALENFLAPPAQAAGSAAGSFNPK